MQYQWTAIGPTSMATGLINGWVAIAWYVSARQEVDG